ncbi:ABC transporter permease [Nocardia sp. NPDC058176]|uniref:ABC transporter permease n=1 Tax=Nocardia sp. NPDC058176 TaxID=3346368 RepID=UPI0036D79139
MTTPSTAPSKLGIAGAATLVRFTIRRERWTVPWWLAGIGTLMAVQSTSSQSLYDTPEKLAQLRETMSANAAAVAMGGPTRLLDTIGGEVVFEIFAYLAITAALMNMFLIGRNTRSDEESGRAELVRSARVGRRAPMTAALGTALIADVAVAVVVGGAAALTGLPVAGSLLLGVAIGGVGFTFAAATAVAAQVFENPRTVYGAVTALIAAAYILRAVGDVGPDAVSWTSPIGWGQRTLPYVADRWWPIALFVVASSSLIAVAFLLSERRDFGAGLLRYRTGRATASPLLGSSIGLVWRLQRAAISAWCVGVFVLGIAYGSFADSIEEFLRDNPEIAAYLAGDAQDAVNSYLALTLSMLALPAAAYGIGGVLRARGEESSGRAELILAGPVGRVWWLSGYLAVAMAGSAAVLIAGGLGTGLAYGVTVHELSQAPRLALAAAVYVPAVWVIVAVATAAVGWCPRVSATLTWVYFGYVAVATIFADAFGLPGWFAAASPLRHTAPVPMDDIDPSALVALLVVAAVIAGAGLLGFRRRDLTG